MGNEGIKYHHNPPPGDGPIYMEVPQLVHLACEEYNSAAAVLAGVQRGVSIIAHGKGPRSVANGRAVITGIDGYFKRLGVCHKLLVAEDEEGDHTLPALKKDYAQLIKDMEAIGELNITLPRTVADFMEDVARALSREDGTPQVLRIVSGRGKVQKEHGYKEVMQSYTDILNLTLLVRQPDFGEVEMLKIPERIAEAAERAGRFHVEGIPNIWTTRLGGVSLKDLVAESSSDTFYAKAMKYLGHIPPGDFFWQRFVESFFFSLPLQAVRMKAEDFSRPQLAKNILSFQLEVVNKLLVPAVTDESEDRRFDAEFKSMLERMSRENVHNLNICMMSTIFLAPYNLQIFYPEVGVRQAATAIPFHEIAYASNRGILFMDFEMRQFLQQQTPQLLKDLEKRFGDVWQGKRLVSLFVDTISQLRPVQAGTRTIEKVLAGEHNKFIEDPEPLLRALEQNKRIARLETSNRVYHQLTFVDTSEEFIARRMKLQNIVFEAVPDEQGEVRFMANLAGGLSYVGGVIEANGELRFVNFEPSDTYHGLGPILTRIIKISYQDLQTQLAERSNKEAPESRGERDETRAEKAQRMLESFFN